MESVIRESDLDDLESYDLEDLARSAEDDGYYAERRPILTRGGYAPVRPYSDPNRVTRLEFQGTLAKVRRDTEALARRSAALAAENARQNRIITRQRSQLNQQLRQAMLLPLLLQPNLKEVATVKADGTLTIQGGATAGVDDTVIEFTEGQKILVGDAQGSGQSSSFRDLLPIILLIGGHGLVRGWRRQRVRSPLTVVVTAVAVAGPWLESCEEAGGCAYAH